MATVQRVPQYAPVIAQIIARGVLVKEWIRILYRCWQERTPYDESTYLQALMRRNSSLIPNRVKAS